MDPDNRKAQLLIRLIGTVQEHFTAFKEPIPIKVLSAKYSRAFQHLGGLPEVIEGLRKEGRIRVFLRKSGSKVVLPSEVLDSVPDSVELK